MQCPVCKDKRMEASQLADGLPAHTCTGCAGHYIRGEQYQKWIVAHRENLPEKNPDESAHLPVADSGPGKLCPECGAFLIGHIVGHDVDFRIDRCGRCGGIWLDANEWETLVARNLHDDVHFIFSKVWQAHAKQAERSESYRSMVFQVLDGQLTAKIGPADLARLKETKAWLDAHPHSADLYAFLRSTRGL